MASGMSKMINLSLKKLVQIHFRPRLNISMLRIDDSEKPSPMARKHCRAQNFEQDNVRGTWLYPVNRHSCKVILYFHGGAYVCGPSIMQWRMLSHISWKSGYRALLINYRKAPEHPFPAALEDMEKTYDILLENTNPKNIIFVGDSAGGGLALALAMKLRDEGKPLPEKMVLFSPWLNVEMDNPETAAWEERDNMLALPGLQEAADLYCGKENKKKPYISPLSGDLNNLPPSYLMVGTNELLLPDCRKLRKKAQEAGWNLKYEEWEEMFHVWMLNIPFLPEAREAINKILQFIQDRDND